MFTKNLKIYARAAGWVIIGVLMLFNAIDILSKAERAFGAPVGSMSLSPLNGLLFQGAPTVPTLINYQGMLRNPEGEPLSGEYVMTYRIYNDIAAPTTAIPGAWLDRPCCASGGSR